MVNSVCNYDSILTATDSNVINSSRYYAIGSSMPDVNEAMIQRSYTVASDNIIVLLLLLALMFISVILYRSRTLIAHNWRLYFVRKRTFTIGRVITRNFWLNSIVLIVIGAFSLSVTLFDYFTRYCNFSEIIGIPYWAIGAFMLLFSAFILLKLILYTILNWVFSEDMLTTSWAPSYIFITSLCALLCYAIVLAEVFSNIDIHNVVNCYIFVAITYEILLIFKLFINFKVKKYGASLIFLYLCTVELVPCIILWRFLQWASDSFIEVNALY